MAKKVFDVWLDEERQIIRQRVYQEPELEDFQRMVAETDKLVCRLRDRSLVRVLADGTWSGRMKKPVRAYSIQVLRVEPPKKLAMVNSNPVVRVVMRFIHTVTGVKNIQVFDDFEEALEWLLL